MMRITVNDDIGRRIKSLPNADEFINSVLEKALLEQENTKKKLEDAAKALSDDYKNDSELTVFTVLDGEDFYV
ncbi:hypothetical protein [Desulfonema magnum]|uniref:Uncharacterized protein n=1 Tax=Desulfonema magnum TaxID=45655 RepID=A0A975BMS9_9BACT|nr:hypothetical protein [Desulfonema magnum]QTA88396.1 Uncharacterized protein dnm_044410 [Desulfonema magnum]